MQSGGLGFGDEPLTGNQDSGNEITRGLQGALGRRFGQQYGAEFDPEYDAGIRGLLGQVPQYQAQFANRRQRVGEDFFRSAEDLDRQNTRANEQHLVAMADRGMGRSGANILGMERLGEAFQRGVQGLGQARQRSLTDLAGEEAGVYQRIRQRQSELEAAGTERARVREERRRWEEEQRRMEEERLRREEQMRQQELQARQQEQAAAEARLRQVEAAALAASQPIPMPTGGYAPGGGGGGGGRGGRGEAAPDHTVATYNYREYDLNNPDSVRNLQRMIGVPADGVYGPVTDRRLRELRGFTFGGRAANPYSGMASNATRGASRGAWDR